MEKEFQQKNLAGPGVSSSHVDTAQPIIYVTSVAPHSSLENSSAWTHSHSCLSRGGGGVCVCVCQSGAKRQSRDGSYSRESTEMVASLTSLLFSCTSLPPKYPQQRTTHFCKHETIKRLFFATTTFKKFPLSSKPFKEIIFPPLHQQPS